MFLIIGRTSFSFLSLNHPNQEQTPQNTDFWKPQTYLWAIHIIRDWLSLLNEFFSASPIVSPFRYNSIGNEHIPVFNPNKNSSLVRVWNFILVYHVNWKQVSRIEGRKPCDGDRSRLNALGWAGRFYHACDAYELTLLASPRASYLLADWSFLSSRSIDISYLGKTEATLLAGSGFTLERNSFQNESHSGII